jgi:hypothetical protein
VATATIAWAIVTIATIAATTITVAQTKKAYKKITVEKVKKDIKAFNKRNTVSVTN